MRLPIIKSTWEYEIKKAEAYGFELRVFQNNMLVYRQGGFGSESIAEIEARDYCLLNEFDIDRDFGG